MSAPPKSHGEPITDKSQLVAYLEAGCKPSADWRIGTEHEKFAFTWSDLRPLPYDGPSGIRALLDGMQRFCWEPVTATAHTIDLTQGARNPTPDPGGHAQPSGP